jgi:CDGSH-type Zn-finger protein/truncated hemoglobin YjbI
MLAAVLELEVLLQRAASNEDSLAQLFLDGLRDRVRRPLQASARAAEQVVVAPQRSNVSGDDAEPAAGMWPDRAFSLAEAATAACVGSFDLGLAEAAAGLQDMALDLVSDDPTLLNDRLARLGELQAGLPCTISVIPNGPYLVTNLVNLSSWLGVPMPVRPLLALCRCGRSVAKPLCDGTHARIGFSSEPSRDRLADQVDTYVGQQVTILDNRGTCQHSGLCSERLATVFRAGQEPFIAPSGGRMDEIIRAVRDCPSGALNFAIDAREAREQVDLDNHREPRIEMSKDGPYRVTGRIPLVDAVGREHARNQGASHEHYALCRCGQSRNKPFCNGMHCYVGFHDPVPSPDDDPTVFEWCGGLPALTRMTRVFYEKYIPEDALLAPLFANMPEGHPQRVAKWLGEVFGGPRCYSEEHGGYDRMVSQHLGKDLTERQRARWVELMRRSSHEAGLPNDAEFRSAFESYLEWGSRVAVENSQPGARPPAKMPMPHWDWHTAGGAPGSRIPADAPAPSDVDAEVVLPGPGEPVRFEQHVRTLFRNRDRQSMRFAFDLWAYDDVSRHADAILERLRSGTMPCDGAWPPEWIDAFARWIASGMPG